MKLIDVIIKLTSFFHLQTWSIRQMPDLWAKMIKSSWYLSFQMDLEQKKESWFRRQWSTRRFGNVNWWSFYKTFYTKPTSYETLYEETILVRRVCHKTSLLEEFVYETLVVQNYWRLPGCIKGKILFWFRKKPFF